MAKWYENLAERYTLDYGEPLVADESWCEPLFSTCEIAVAAQADMGYEDFVGNAMHDEVVGRTADVIAVMTYGVDEAAKMREGSRRRVRGGA